MRMREVEGMGGGKVGRGRYGGYSSLGMGLLAQREVRGG